MSSYSAPYSRYSKIRIPQKFSQKNIVYFFFWNIERIWFFYFVHLDFFCYWATDATSIFQCVSFSEDTEYVPKNAPLISFVKIITIIKKL